MAVGMLRKSCTRLTSSALGANPCCIADGILTQSGHVGAIQKRRNRVKICMRIFSMFCNTPLVHGFSYDPEPISLYGFTCDCIFFFTKNKEKLLTKCQIYSIDINLHTGGKIILPGSNCMDILRNNMFVSNQVIICANQPLVDRHTAVCLSLAVNHLTPMVQIQHNTR